MKRLKQTLAAAAILALAGGASYVTAQGNPAPQKQARHTMHDANGDGVCDICNLPVGSGMQNGQGRNAQNGNHYGPGDGSGNRGVGPGDCTGYGAAKGSGPRDGSGARQGQLNKVNGAARGRGPGRGRS